MQILVKPIRSNTASCIAYASSKIATLNLEADIVVASSDDLILKEDVLSDKLRLALDCSSERDELIAEVNTFLKNLS